MILLFLSIYIIAVMITQAIGRPQAEGAAELFKSREVLFSTVPRSMFTIFRCLTEGCADADGTPLLVKLGELYGFQLLGGYVLVFVLVTYGLENLIVAVFIESTLEAARMNEAKIAAAQEHQNVRVAR